MLKDESQPLQRQFEENCSFEALSSLWLVCSALMRDIYTQSLIQAPHISNTFETGQNLGKIKQSTGVFKKKIEKISNNSNTSKQR